MKLYTNGNYFIEQSYYGTFDVWCRKSLVDHFETLDMAIKYIEEEV